MTGSPPMCTKCDRLLDDKYKFICEAFRTGIPKQIIMGFDHRKPFPGDGGLRFKPKEGPDEGVS